MIRDDADTIVAVATPAGRGGVGVLRLSGPRAATIAERLAGAALPSPRRAALRGFRDVDGGIIDHGLLLYFRAPASFTGEDVVELQTHGSPMVLKMLQQAACVAGARPARPGEFTERAYLNGRMDLVQAEAVADLIDAASDAAARAARRSLDGEFSRRVNGLAETMIDLRAWLEGALDFADEDVDWLSDRGLLTRVEGLRADLAALATAAERGRRLHDGLTVAIAGQPNVGKSTLLNRLAGADAAIVTDQPGTTRDLLREHLLLDALPVTVIDTAGLRASDDPVEKEGIRRARAAFESVDLLLYVVDDRDGLTATDQAVLSTLPPQPRKVLIYNKCDLSGRAAAGFETASWAGLRLSAASGEGIGELRVLLQEAAGLGDAEESLFSARARHLEALRRAAAYVDEVGALLRSGAATELAAEELRMAHATLGEITGRVTTEDLLGRIFAGFCIGK